ncbi:RPS31 30S ribosomal protein S31 [Leeuwenhoekiella marinoflava DSM 3653]|uniref:SSU ribosomal protein S31P n=2 Tax=Leeuwenhoekiella marinoflava TaxID=988 RepID=A0A4Q0PIL8_9FLAO|nr:SSU ribosomal protein S31P [Leeuwenhoekiella marinoflava]SHF40315.1 RPS31 30S ribosomal protein S31 [Leeuwenhoekiella marinoflava DSM 3653]
MGKGDQKTKRGKIHRGTYGKLRPRKNKKRAATTADVPTKQTATKTKEAGKTTSDKSLAEKKP